MYHQFTIRVPEFPEPLARHLEAQGIGSRVVFPLPIHRTPAYLRLGYGEVSCREADRASEEVLSIPVHPALGEEELNRIVRAVRNFTPRE